MAMYKIYFPFLKNLFLKNNYFFIFFFFLENNNYQFLKWVIFEIRYYTVVHDINQICQADMGLYYLTRANSLILVSAKL